MADMAVQAGSEAYYNEYAACFNCYAYAAGDTNCKNNSGASSRPGAASGHPMGYINEENLRAAVVSDGFEYAGMGMPPERSGMRIVAAVVDEGDDFHFYLSGEHLWSHKRSHLPVSHSDANRDLIFNPKSANRNYGDTNYETFVGYFYCPAEGIDTKGESGGL